MNKVVFDASALLAFLNGESGAEIVRPYLGAGYLSTVNYAEVLSSLINRGVDQQAAEAALSPLVELIHFDVKQAAWSAQIRPLTKEFGLSLGDRACLALAYHFKSSVLTADKIWGKLDLGVEVLVIR